METNQGSLRTVFDFACDHELSLHFTQFLSHENSQMPYSLHNEAQLSTVTAVALFRHLVLAGEGPHLKIYIDDYTGRTLINHTTLSLPRDSRVPVLIERCFDEHSIHGISVLELNEDQLLTLVWGGHHVRVFLFGLDCECPILVKRICSTYLSCMDWILHASFTPQPSSAGDCVKAALITAHNSLVELTVQLNVPSKPSSEEIAEQRRLEQLQLGWHPTGRKEAPSEPSDVMQNKTTYMRLSMADLSASTRCTLYTAHLFWLPEEHILVASGTAFGEIIVWSCFLKATAQSSASSRINVHHVFTAHEGSVFGLDVLHVPSVNESEPKLLVASCSDDRTIRIWDASHALRSTDTGSAETFPIPTGVDNEGADSIYPVPERYAQGWAHTSRIWHIAFLPFSKKQKSLANTIQLVSIGEDATYQHWSLEKSFNGSASLKHVETFSNHVGKNIWSYGLLRDDAERIKLVTGGADGTVAVSELQKYPDDLSKDLSRRYEWQFDSLRSVITDDEPSPPQQNEVAERPASPELEDGEGASKTKKTPKKMKKSKNAAMKKPPNGFKAYGFVDSRTLLLSTRRGEALLGTMIGTKSVQNQHSSLKDFGGEGISWRLLDGYNNLAGYSVLQCLPECRLAFFTGTDGIIYSYHHGSSTVSTVCQVEGRVGSLLAEKVLSWDDDLGHEVDEIYLVVTRLGQSIAHVFQWAWTNEYKLAPHCSKFDLNLPKDFIATTAKITRTARIGIVLWLGSREGEVAQFSPLRSGKVAEVDHKWSCHSDSITSFFWTGSHVHPESGGYLVTTGRDSSYAITQIFLTKGSRELISRLSFPFGPYIEGFNVRNFDMHLIFHGFQSRYFVVYDETAQREIMRVDCGGAHRSWSFDLAHDKEDLIVGTFIWTQASKLCKYSALRHVQTVVRPGGHGREIKACAVNSTSGIIATGAEDTDIRLFSGLECVSVVRKHNTGLQGLQWSANGRYLFSCAGCEEFYVWKVSAAPFARIGVVCVGAMPTNAVAGHVPEQRITDFEAIELQSDSKDVDIFMISLVLSDSTIRVYRLSCTAEKLSWDSLYSGQYTTACLTLCQFVGQCRPGNAMRLVTGSTDGHLAFWNLNEKLRLDHVQRVHQNSIKCLAIVSLDQDETDYLVFTGGDDNGLAVTRVDLHDKIRTSTLLLPRAHAAAVTAMTVLPRLVDSKSETTEKSVSTKAPAVPKIFTVLTTSNDQRVKTWNFTIDETSDGVTGIEVTRISNNYTPVADASCVGLIPYPAEQGRVGVVICGVGMDIWHAAGRS